MSSGRPSSYTMTSAQKHTCTLIFGPTSVTEGPRVGVLSLGSKLLATEVGVTGPYDPQYNFSLLSLEGGPR